MLPAVHDPVHLIDEQGHQLPGIVLAVEGEDLFTVRLDAGHSGPVGTPFALTWIEGPDVLQFPTTVVDRSVIDNAPAVTLHGSGEITKVQRRRYVRVPVQRPIAVRLDPIPLDPALVGIPTQAKGLTLDVAEASVRCSLRQRDAAAFTAGATVELRFELDGDEFVLEGEVARAAEIVDEETPRVELVVMLTADENGRTAIRRALFAEQIRMRATV